MMRSEASCWKDEQRVRCAQHCRYPWLNLVNPQALPSEWLALDLGAGELAAMALALENPARIVLLDDMLARRTAQAAGLSVWGTLRVLLEAKAQGLTDAVAEQARFSLKPVIPRPQKNIFSWQ